MRPVVFKAPGDAAADTMSSSDAMPAGAAEAQISQMTKFILYEAKEKVQEIERRGEQDYSIEKTKIIAEGQEKTRQYFERLAKQNEVNSKIQKSKLINDQRLEKITKRQEVIMMLEKDAKKALLERAKKADGQKTLIQQLIVQCMLHLLEDAVQVKCRESDAAMVKGVFTESQAAYSKIIKEKTGATKSCSLTLDTQFLPATCSGGVALSCQDGKISIDNTLDTRLRLVMEQDKPAIRKALFPQK